MPLKIAKIAVCLSCCLLFALMACTGNDDREAGGGVIDETFATVLTGDVVDKAGNPVPGCSLTVRDLLRPVAGSALAKTMVEQSDSILTLFSDAQGRFEIRGLQPSQYSVEARFGTAFGSIEKVELKEFDSLDVKVELDTLVVLTIWVDSTLGATRAYIVELDRFVDVSGKTSVAIVGIPGGSYTIRILKDSQYIETVPVITQTVIQGEGLSSSQSSSSSWILPSSSSGFISSSSVTMPTSSSSQMLSGQVVVACPDGASPLWTCIQDDRDGEIYGTIQVGTQYWFAQGIRHGEMLKPLYTDVTDLSNHRAPSDSTITEKYCYFNDTANCRIYGGLYRYSEAFGLPLICDDDPEGNDECTPIRDANGHSQGICPDGWHIPTLEEWNALATTLASRFSLPAPQTSFQAGLGGILNGFYAPDTGSWNQYYQKDPVGFAALPTGYHHGYYDDKRHFEGMGTSLYYILDASNGDSTFFTPMFSRDAVYVISSMSKRLSHSLRCVSDRSS